MEKIKDHFFNIKKNIIHKKYDLHYSNFIKWFNYVIPGMMEIAEIKENIKINKTKKFQKNLALIYYEYKK